ncbi:MAG: helix-turn-helix domain-containing protein [Enterococcus lacertideformus]|uniref:Helix-turn-helix domain-containing protein n=1 Tax=Enterococcus lacertideformus TaxID=2771493 RepID=A0A931AXY3_9ENTE|nr:helix-turn-helix domain-containing protein [Enterococcus lacertideformus]
MIEDYIEKDIIRKVKLVEFLFELKELNVSEAAERLGVTFNTIKADFQKLVIRLEADIDYYKMTSSHLLIFFKPNIRRYDLIKQIYQDSNFLRVCSRYIIGEHDYLTLVDEEFLSVTKVFKIKKVENYFSEALVPLTENPEDSLELQQRFLILSIWMRCDYLDTQIDPEIMVKSEKYADKILHVLSNRLNKTQYTFFKLAIYLSLSRQKSNPVTFPEDTMIIMQNGIIFNMFREIFIEHDEALSSEEIAYLAIIYRTLPYNSPNYFMLEIDLLIEMFEKEFGVNLFGNILFEVPLFNLLYTCALNIGNFLVTKHIFLSEEQLLVLNRVKLILKKWTNELDTPINHIPYFHLQEFCQLTFFILTNGNLTKTGIVIVAENETSHIAFRNSLEKRMSTSDLLIDTTLYYSLDDVPEYIRKSDQLIICERTLLSKENFNNKNIFPISLNSISADIKKIATCIMNLD